MALPDPMVLRASQLRALGLGARDSYLERLAPHVAEVFPTHAAFIQGARGRRFLERCLVAAGRYALHDQHSVALFTDLAVALGEGFELRPAHAWIREILEDRGLGAAGKMFLIYKDLPERCPDDPLPPPEGDDDDSEPPPAPLVALWPSGDWG